MERKRSGEQLSMQISFESKIGAVRGRIGTSKHPVSSPGIGTGSCRCHIRQTDLVSFSLPDIFLALFDESDVFFPVVPENERLLKGKRFRQIVQVYPDAQAPCL